MREKSIFRKNILFVIAVILSVLVALLATKETVMSQGRTDSKGKKNYYKAMEAEYRSNMEQVLEENGYSNSGITIRWVSENGETRIYTVMIHHKRIDRLDENEKEKLIQELAKTEFSDEGCSFQYEFLILKF